MYVCKCVCNFLPSGGRPSRSGAFEAPGVVGGSHTSPEGVTPLGGARRIRPLGGCGLGSGVRKSPELDRGHRPHSPPACWWVIKHRHASPCDRAGPSTLAGDRKGKSPVRVAQEAAGWWVIHHLLAPRWVIKHRGGLVGAGGMCTATPPARLDPVLGCLLKHPGTA